MLLEINDRRRQKNGQRWCRNTTGPTAYQILLDSLICNYPSILQGNGKNHWAVHLQHQAHQEAHLTIFNLLLTNCTDRLFANQLLLTIMPFGNNLINSLFVLTICQMIGNTELLCSAHF